MTMPMAEVDPPDTYYGEVVFNIAYKGEKKTLTDVY
jgi:hypothetical protein